MSYYSVIKDVQTVIDEYNMKSEDDISGAALSAMATIIANDEDAAEWMFEEINESQEGYCSMINLIMSMTEGFMVYMSAAKSMVIEMERRGDVIYYDPQREDLGHSQEEEDRLANPRGQ